MRNRFRPTLALLAGWLLACFSDRPPAGPRCCTFASQRGRLRLTAANGQPTYSYKDTCCD